MARKVEQLAEAIAAHYPHPVFGCECTPVLADGTKEVLDRDWSLHVTEIFLALAKPDSLRDALVQAVVNHTLLTERQFLGVSMDAVEIEIVYDRHAGTHIERRQTILAADTTELLSDIEIGRREL